MIDAIAGAAARLAGELLSELARLLQAAIPWLVSLAPWLLRAAITVLAVLVIVDAWPGLFIAFGADLPATLPASVYAIGPHHRRLSAQPSARSDLRRLPLLRQISRRHVLRPPGDLAAAHRPGVQYRRGEDVNDVTLLSPIRLFDNTCKE